MTTPILDLDEWESAQAQPEVVVNEAHRWLECFTNLVVASQSISDPPSAVDGDRYIVGADATGVWTGHDLQVALLMGVVWKFKTAPEGALAYVEDETAQFRFVSGAWTPAPEGPPGPAGADGADGADGAPGADGADGAPGADGADGADGAEGPAGADGADGADGAEGPEGPQGPEGPEGPPGADGVDGTQTYSLFASFDTASPHEPCFRISVAGVISLWAMSGEGGPGDAVVDVRSSGSITTPPTSSGDSMCPGFEPELAAELGKEQADLSDWATTTVNVGDVVQFVLTSFATFTRVHFQVDITPTP